MQLLGTIEKVDKKNRTVTVRFNGHYVATEFRLTPGRFKLENPKVGESVTQATGGHLFFGHGEPR